MCGHEAKWMWTPDWRSEDDGQPRLVYFRKSIMLDESLKDCLVRVCADTRYKLYVNGSFVEFGPSKGDNKVRFVDTVDIAPYLKPGKNTVAVTVLRVPVSGETGNHSFFASGIAGLYIEGIGSEGWICAVDRRTTYFAEEQRFAPLWIHEHVEAGIDVHGERFDSAYKLHGAHVGDDFEISDAHDGHGSSKWLPVCFYADDTVPDILKKENLVPRTIPYMKRTRHGFDLQERVFPSNTVKTFVLDAGEEMCAFIRLAMAGGHGAEIELLYSECYVREDGSKGNRLDAEHGHLTGYKDTYEVSGPVVSIMIGKEAAAEVYEPFWFRTFRFIQVTVRTGDEPLELISFEYEETGYPLEVKTKVRTSDSSLEPVWDISLRTLRRCMHETYIDCPFYEQLQYAMDTRSQILYTYAISADDRLARKAIDDFSRAQRPDGLINCSYPNKNVNVIPGFALYFILMLHDHMMYFGDKELVLRYMPTVDRIFGFFDAHMTPDGLVDKVGGVNGKAPFWSFIDWAYAWLPTEGMPAAGLDGPITMESLLLLLALQKAGELATFVETSEREEKETVAASVQIDDEPNVEKTDINIGGAGECADKVGEYVDGADEHSSKAGGNVSKADAYLRKAAALQSAIRRCCVDADGMIVDGPGSSLLSQHCQVFGILTGTLSEEEGRRNLLRSIEDKGESIAQCTVAMCYYLFRAMERVGLYEHTDQYWDIWRKMVANGCTTCVESEGYARSECHAWGALALYELPSVVLGVRPAALGYEKILVRPHAGYMASASGTVHTPKGDVTVRWRKDEDKSGDRLHVEVECDDSLRECLLVEA